jgi:hypothetical protein
MTKIFPFKRLDYNKVPSRGYLCEILMLLGLNWSYKYCVEVGISLGFLGCRAFLLWRPQPPT